MYPYLENQCPVFFHTQTALTSTSAKDLEVNLTEEGELDTVEDNMEPVWFREIDQEDKGNLTDDDGLG